MNLTPRHNARLLIILCSIISSITLLNLTGCKSAPKEAPVAQSSPQATPAPAATAPTPSVAPGGQVDFDQTAKGTQPLAYYRLAATNGASEIGTTTYASTGGVTVSSSGLLSGLADTQFAVLNGKDGWIKTTQMGGIDKTGSIMAWVNLATLPSKGGHFYYVAGESQSGNDFDIQFETNDALRFYTSGGGNVAYTPDPATLVNQWHMIVATMDCVAPNKTLYWDGKAVASDQSGNTPRKSSQFSIGESTVFTGRFFNGGISEVALWNRVLSPAEVATLYNLATVKP